MHVETTPAVDLNLNLVSEDAHKAFLTNLRHEYINGMDADVWLSIQKEKNAEQLQITHKKGSTVSVEPFLLVSRSYGRM